MSSDERVATDVLRSAKRIAVIGWSPDPQRPSHGVADYLHRQGYDVLPVNPNYVGQDAYGHPVVATMTELTDVDIVDVFRRSSDVARHVDETLELGAPVFWMQLGVHDDEAARRLEAKGVTVIENRCTAADHRQFGLGR